MTLRLLVACSLLAAALAGCASSPLVADTNAPIQTGALPLLAGPALWNDPQDAPHPAYGWATLSNPPDLNRTDIPRWWLPINATELPTHIAGIQQLANVGGNLTIGAGIALFGSIAFVPGEGAGSWTVDLSEPLHPKVLGEVESHGRGAAFIAFPDGRLVVASATTPGFDVVDVTDPVHPVLLNQTTVPVNGGHKLGIVPGTPILYNAGSQGGDPGVQAGPVSQGHPLYGPGACNADISQCVGYTEIYNLTDPAHPTLVQNFQNGLSCHHIFFYNSPTKSRAICAGIQYTQLWDTTNPLDPKVIVSLPVHSGAPGTPSAMLSIEAFSHSAGLSASGNILYVGDESGGGGVPPGCVGSVDTPLGSVAVPVGATWFYDVSDEANPRLLGYYSPGVGAGTYVSGVPIVAGGSLHSTSCTTHHGRLVPDKEGRDLLAMSYYGDGVVLLDFTGMDVAAGKLPTVVGRFADNTNTWETWYNGGYLFTGDLSRGMDVIGFT